MARLASLRRASAWLRRRRDGPPVGEIPSPAAFISYARKDAAFVAALHAALEARGRDVWVDWSDIPGGARWWDEIVAGIRSARCVVYVITAASVASATCRQEIVEAAKAGKRIVPILREAVPLADIPEAAQAHNFIDFGVDEALETNVDRLVQAIDFDAERVHGHTRLLLRAHEWANGGKGDELRLRGADLQRAEAWLATASGQPEPRPTPLQIEYVLASRRSETGSQRRRLGLAGAVVAISVVLAATAVLQSLAAEHQERVAVAEASRANELAALAETRRVAADAEKAVAQEQRDEVIRQQAVTLSHDLAARAERETDDIVPALRMALAAYALDPSPEAARGLAWVLTAYPQAAGVLATPSPVSRIAFADGGDQIVGLTEGRSIVRWDAASGRQLGAAVPTGQEPLSALAVSPDERRLATGDFVGRIIVWDLSTLEPVAELQAGGDLVTDLEWHPSGSFLIAADLSSPEMHVWDTATWQARHGITAPAGGQLVDLAFSPDGSTLATGELNEPIAVWSFPDGRLLRRIAGSEFGGGLVFLADGRSMVAGDNVQSAVIWDAETGDGTAFEGLGGAVSIARSGNLTAVADDDITTGSRLLVWQGELSGGPRHRIAAHGASMALSAKAQRVISVQDGIPIVWDLAASGLGREVATGAADEAPIAMALSGAVAIGGPSVHVLSKLGRRTVEEQAAVVAVTSDAGRVAIVRDQNVPRVDLRDVDGRELASWSLSGQEWIGMLAFDPAGTRLAVGSYTTTDLDVEYGDAIAFNGRVTVHEVPSGRIVFDRTLDGEVESLAFAGDGSELGAVVNGRTIIWDPADGSVVDQYEPPPIRVGMYAVGLDVDGRRIAILGSDGVTVVDLRTLGASFVPTLSRADAATVAAAVGGSRLVTRHDDGRVFVWSLDPGAWRDTACAILDRNLTEAEWTELAPNQAYEQVCPGVP